MAMDSTVLRLTDGFGIALASLDVCRRELDGWAIGAASRSAVSPVGETNDFAEMVDSLFDGWGVRTGPRSIVSLVGETNDFAEVAEFLSHLTHPATRHVLIPLGEATLFTNNRRDGPDFADYVYHVSLRLHTRAARVVNHPARVRTIGGERERLSYEARMLVVYDDGEHVRSMACADDSGRWTSESHGDPLPVEEAFDPAARRKKDRFTSANLRALVAAYGLPYPELESFVNADQYLLMYERHLPEAWERRIEEHACTPEQRDDPAWGYYQRGLGWLPFMDTHAASVVADFERAVRLNPAFEPLVRKHLKRARRIVRRGW